MSGVIGFDRKIELNWLNSFADQVSLGGTAKEHREYLRTLLAEAHPGAVARGKSVTVMMRIWALVPAQQHPIREEAFALLQTIAPQDRVWLHWGMAQMAYPIFRDLASTIGRLLKLQEEVLWGQLHRRLASTWGERTTVKKAVPRLVRSMVDWGTLSDSENNRSFTAAESLKTKSKHLQLWLLKTAHCSQPKETIEFSELLGFPNLFPFKFTISKSDLRDCESFALHRQGMDMDMIEYNASQTQ